MFVLPKGPTVYVDVDDTLIMWNPPKNLDNSLWVRVKCPSSPEEENAVVNKHVLEHLKKMKRRGHVVVVWSAGEVEWAEAAVKALGIEDYVDAVMSKPKYYIDDVKDSKHWIGKYGYITYEGEVIKGDKHTVQLEE